MLREARFRHGMALRAWHTRGSGGASCLGAAEATINQGSRRVASGRVLDWPDAANSLPHVRPARSEWLEVAGPQGALAGRQTCALGGSARGARRCRAIAVVWVGVGVLPQGDYPGFELVGAQA
jgi:hypothetical protein